MRFAALCFALFSSSVGAAQTPPPLNAVIAYNPDAASIRKALDAERAAGKVRSPVHGKEILIKDNIETADRMATTAGSLALKDNITGRDAPLVARLRAAGALILGKANMSEWANIRSNRSMSGWSAIGGLVRNPYALDRTACGSSSGSGAAIAAGLAWAAIGTETDGSIVCPASINGLVGLKPTKGRISGERIIPISHSQDTAGPMARTVRDVAMIIEIVDTMSYRTAIPNRFTSALTGSIKGIRIGVLREEIGRQPATRAVFEAALATLKNAGAILIDIDKTGAPDGIGKAETIVLHTELKADLNAYLATTPKSVKTRTLADVIAFNTANASREMPYFGQETFIEAEATKGLADPIYLKALKDSGDGARETLTRLLTDNKVAILIAPTMGPAWLSDPVNGDQYDGPSASQLPAVSGFPHLTVPMGQVMGLPVGLSFIGPAWSEAALLNAGDAYEQARGPLPAPTYPTTISVR
jgi:amidase